MSDKPTKLTGVLTRIHVDADADAVNAGMAGMGFERVDDTKCPKCGAEAVSYGCAGPVYKCGRIGTSPFGIHPVCEERQIATLTSELAEARAACAGLIEHVRTECLAYCNAQQGNMWHKTNALYNELKAIASPGQPMLDKLDRLRDENKALCEYKAMAEPRINKLRRRGQAIDDVKVDAAKETPT